MMRTLLLGGTGFIGACVARQIEKAGHEVAVFHRGTSASALPPAVQHITGDRHRLGDSIDAFRAFAPALVIDLILSSESQARETMNAFRGIARRIIALSSMDVYRACGVLHGFETGPLEPIPLTESSPLRTRLRTYPAVQVKMLQQLFGWLDEEYDKIPVERVVLSDPALPGTILRLPMVYGPGDPLHRVFPLVKRMDDRRPVIIFEARAAEWRSPRGYVENVAAAIALAATSDRTAGCVYNVGEPENYSEIEWAQRIGAVARWSGEFVVLPNGRVRPHLRVLGNLDQHWVADTSRIRAELGYREPIEPDEAIRRTIEWERANPPARVDPLQFDYAAEDRAVVNLP